LSTDLEPRARWRVPAVVRDIMLLVLGAALALGVEEWRDAHAERRRVAAALLSIRAELLDNQQRVEKARAHHLRMADTLSAYRARHQLPPPRVYFESGVLQPALPLSTAWQTARETGALSGLPYPVVLAIAPVYEAQARYRAVGDALTQSIMVDVQRRGVEPVLRDDFANFISVERDFAQREQVLSGEYARTIAQLDSATGVRGP
jgi:hypothetical protein